MGCRVIFDATFSTTNVNLIHVDLTFARLAVLLDRRYGVFVVQSAK